MKKKRKKNRVKCRKMALDASRQSIAPSTTLPQETAPAALVGEHLPSDNQLLDRVRTQWQLGAWQALAALDVATLWHHRERAQLYLFKGVGQAQQGDLDGAKVSIQQAVESGVNRRLLAQALISGAYNTLGRAAALSGRTERAAHDFQQAINIAAPGCASQTAVELRLREANYALTGTILKSNQIFDSASIDFFSRQKFVLLFVTSITEMITAIASLKSEGGLKNDEKGVIIFYGRDISVTEKLKSEVESVCNEIYWNFVFLDGADLNKIYKNSKFPKWSVNKIYISRLFGDLENAILEKWRQSEIFLFDNGIFSHEPVCVSKSYNPKCILESHLKRVSSAYYSLLEYMDPPKLITESNCKIQGLKSDELLREFKCISGGFIDRFQILLGKKEACIVLGTSFYRGYRNCFEREKLAYQDIVTKLVNEGKFVVFKPHHRQKQVLLDNFSFDNLMILDVGIPAELIPIFCEVKSAFSIASTALLLLHKIFGITPSLIGNDVLQENTYFHAHKLRKLIASLSASQTN